MKKARLLLALIAAPGVAFALDRPDWAFPPETLPRTAVVSSDDGKPKQVPGSARTYTQKEINSLNNPPDWFPDEHPPMPKVVSNGNGPAVRACISCHLSNGQGHPENSRVPGGTARYLAQQIYDMRSGARRGAGGAMIAIAKAMSEDEIAAASEYFSKIKPIKWTRVVEASSVPKTFYERGRRLVDPEGGTEPIGSRIIEVPEDQARMEMRDPHSGFIAYVPPGSIARGEALVTSGDNGKTIPCAICHGVMMKGLGDVPSIAGQSPGTIARQMYFMVTGARDGIGAQLMKPVVEKLTAYDLLAIAAYVGSLDP